VPGSIGRDGSYINVGSWHMKRKLVEAARRSKAMLPAEAREQFAALFSPTNLEITGAVLVVWGASHLVVAGEVADSLLLGVGFVFMGWQVFGAGRDMAAYLSIATHARTALDLDRAAKHLSRAVVTIGVTAFLALVMKYGRRLGLGARAYWGQTVEEWLAELGKPREPPLVRVRVQEALAFFRDYWGDATKTDVKGWLKAIDFNQDVKRVSLKADTKLVQYRDGSLGSWFSDRGVSWDRLGVSKGSRQFVRVRLKQDIEVLRSTAAPAVDNWTKHQPPRLAAGGGRQYQVPNLGKNYASYFEIIQEGTRP
jgi:Bacterial toxin 46